MPAAISELNSTVEDYAIFTADELQAFVSSRRAPTQGGLDIFYTRRASTSDPFPPPTPLDALNSPVSETATYVSDDGCTVYFKRATSPVAEYKILVATRP